MSSNNNNRKRRVETAPTGETLAQMMGGKLPPQARELEEAVIGAMLLHNDTIMDVKMVLKADDFYVVGNQLICQAIFDLQAKHQPADMLTVAQKLRERSLLDDVGGPYYITRCTNSVTSDISVLFNARIIKQYSIARKLLIFSSDIMQKAYSDDVFDSLDFAESKLYQIFEEIKTAETTDISVMAVKAVQDTLEIKDAKDWVVTGIPAWDRVNGPLTPNLYVVAGRPGTGKTALLCEMIKRMGTRYPVGVINGEMGQTQMINRMVPNLVEFDMNHYKVHREDWPQEWFQHYYSGIQEFVNLKLHIYSESQDLEEVCNMITFYVRKFGCKAIMIDYLQIISLPPELQRAYNTDTLRISYVTNRFRALAKKLGVPFILLSQFNRESTKRENKRPTTAELKGSGTIEEAAYQIMILHRPEVYGIMEEDGENTRGLCYGFIDKHRDGELAELKFRFIGKYMKFDEWENEFAGWNPMEAVKGSNLILMTNNNPDDTEAF